MKKLMVMVVLGISLLSTLGYSTISSSAEEYKNVSIYNNAMIEIAKENNINTTPNYDFIEEVKSYFPNELELKNTIEQLDLSEEEYFNEVYLDEVRNSIIEKLGKEVVVSRGEIQKYKEENYSDIPRKIVDITYYSEDDTNSYRTYIGEWNKEIYSEIQDLKEGDISKEIDLIDGKYIIEVIKNLSDDEMEELIVQNIRHNIMSDKLIEMIDEKIR